MSPLQPTHCLAKSFLFRVGLLALQAAWVVNGRVARDEHLSDSFSQGVESPTRPVLHRLMQGNGETVGQEGWQQEQVHEEEGNADGDEELGKERGEETGRRISGSPLVLRLRDIANSTAATHAPLQWRGAGGEYGLSADWKEILSVPDGRGHGGDMRGEACMTDEKQAEVRAILARRRATPSTKKVAVCLRTKDFGRFLPEWLAFHYAVGVDEVTVYDDDSVDDTREVLQPFIEAGLQQRREGHSDAATWVLFHDTDEYLFPTDSGLTIRDALERHKETCCVM